MDPRAQFLDPLLTDADQFFSQWNMSALVCQRNQWQPENTLWRRLSIVCYNATAVGASSLAKLLAAEQRLQTTEPNQKSLLQIGYEIADWKNMHITSDQSHVLAWTLLPPLCNVPLKTLMPAETHEPIARDWEFRALHLLKQATRLRLPVYLNRHITDHSPPLRSYANIEPDAPATERNIRIF